MNKKTIGILGGSGPSATANIFNKIIETAQKKYGAVEDTDFPSVVVFSSPLHELDERGFRSEANMDQIKKRLGGSVAKLKESGCDFIIIACNTLHAFYDSIIFSKSSVVVDMVGETSQFVYTEGLRRVGVLSSRSTRDLGLYASSLGQYGIEEITTDEHHQVLVDKIILSVMSGKVSSDTLKNLGEVIKNMIAKGAEAIVLGCTELSLLTSEVERFARVIDSSEVAVNFVLDKTMGNY